MKKISLPELHLLKLPLLILVIILVVVFLSSATFALSANDVLWKGSINVYLDKQSYDQNEEITGNVVINNDEAYPIIGGKLVFQIAQGEFSYPSQNSKDNVVYENTLSELMILPNSSKSFSFTLPKQYSGSYRLDVYSWVQKSMLSGADSIFLSPVSNNFNATGNNLFNRASIVRDKTVFTSSKSSGVGPVGFPAVADLEITGSIFIKNNSSELKENLKLTTFVCEWSSVFCKEYLEVKEISISSLGGNETKSVEVKLIAPNLPSAYEINLVLSSSKGIESIYKNRVIVEGPTTKVRKMFLTGFENQQFAVNAIIAGSPDHFNYPSFSDFKLVAQIFDNNSLVEEKSIDVPIITSDSIIEKRFDFVSKSFSKICILAEKSGKVYETECINVPLDLFLKSYFEKNPPLVAVSWEYDETSKQLKIKLTKNKINSEVTLYSKENIVFSENVLKTSVFEKIIQTEKENFVLLVDDVDAKKQQVININLAIPANQESSSTVSNTSGAKEVVKCLWNSCANSQTCTGESYLSKDGLCCKDSCIESVEEINQTNIFSLPLIFWIALILAIIGILSAFNAARVMMRA